MLLRPRINKLAQLKNAAYYAGYNSVYEKLAIDSKTVRPQPLSSTGDAKLDVEDEGTPVGSLVSAFEQMSDPVARDSANNQHPEDNVEDRLNRPATWSTASTISMEDATGASPIMMGAY